MLLDRRRGGDHVPAALRAAALCRHPRRPGRQPALGLAGADRLRPDGRGPPVCRAGRLGPAAGRRGGAVAASAAAPASCRPRCGPCRAWARGCACWRWRGCTAAWPCSWPRACRCWPRCASCRTWWPRPGGRPWRRRPAQIERGERLSEALEAQDLATPVARRMVRVGERSGEVAAMLERAAAFHDEEAVRLTELLTRAINPAADADHGRADRRHHRA